MSNRLFAASSLSVSYGQHVALQNVELSLSAGEMVALLGPNGSGKSTLIRSLIGLTKSTGDVNWNDQPLSRISHRQLARIVAYLPQSPTYEPSQRVIDVLRLGRYPYWSAFGVESMEDAQVIERVAEQLQLDDLLTREIDQLSGGQRQRVFIGRCLVQQPKALLLDEPNTFLDLKHQVELCSMLKSLAGQKLGVLMALHDLNLAGLFADRAILLKEGRIVMSGSPQEVLGSPMLDDAYGLPIRRIGDGFVLPMI